MTPASRTTPRRCSIAGALDVVGEKWSLLVIRELFLGVRRFSEIAANTGAPRDILTARLRRLEELGVKLPPVLEHTCGHVFEPRTACAACGEVIDNPRSLSRVDAATTS